MARTFVKCIGASFEYRPHFFSSPLSTGFARAKLLGHAGATIHGNSTALQKLLPQVGVDLYLALF
jgi:hypothetical protein